MATVLLNYVIMFVADFVDPGVPALSDNDTWLFDDANVDSVGRWDWRHEGICTSVANFPWDGVIR